MVQEILTFGDIEIEKSKFYRFTSRVPLRDVDIENTLTFNKISSGEKNHKYFIGYRWLVTLLVMMDKLNGCIF